jgi:PAS domain S-box-containing protein
MNPGVKSTVSDDLVERLARAEEALRSRELSFQLIVDSTPVPVAVTTPTGEVEAVNQPTLEYFGKTFEELRGWKASDVVHPDDLERTIATQQTAHETGTAYNVESRHRRSDGIYRWFNVRGFPLRDNEGRILRWFHLLIDIDDRKRAETQLAGEKVLLEMVASGASLKHVLTSLCRFVEYTAADCKCGIYLIDWNGPTFHTGAAPSLPATFNDVLEGLSVSASAGPCGLAALTTSQVIAEDLESDPHWQESLIRPLALRHGIRAQWSTPVCSRDGSVLATFAVFQDHPASPNQFHQDLIAQVTHIASIAIERAAGEEALKRSERELKLIIDTIPAMAWSAHPDGTGEFLNQQYLDYVGLSAQQVRDWGWTAAIHPDDREGLTRTWRHIMASEQSGEAEARLRRHDGEYRWFLFRASPARDDSGRVVKWYGTNIDITERKLALESLQANQDLLDLAQKSAGAMAFDWYVQKQTNHWSPEQEALYGLLPGSFDGTYQSWKKLIYLADWPVLISSIEHAHETGDVRAEFRVKWPDGSVHWLATNGQMFFDDQGKPFRMVGFTTDVTRRKLIEEELRRSTAFLEQAQQLSRTGSFSWRVAADEINWSEELYRIYEFDPGIKITIEVIRTRVHPEDLTLYEKMVEQARNGADDFEWQYRLLMPDQSIKYMHAVAQATRDPNGQLEYIAAVQDVTRRKLIEEEMRRSEAFLAEGQRLSTTGSFVWRPDTDEIVFSDELKRIFGFELGMPVTLERIVGCVHPDDMSLVAEKIAQARAGGGDHDYELRLRMPDGSVKYLHTNARANRRPDGYLEFVGAMQDVTLRRLAEEALGKARSELAHATRIMSLGVLTASIAHEVNQPLSGIITNASTCVRMLDGDPPNVDGARETAKRTIRDGRRAADVITRLRALFSKKDAAYDLVDLNEATREVIALSRSELERNGVITRTELTNELPLVRGDRVQLQQVIVNLLRNGSDAMSTVDGRPRELLFRTEVEEADRVRLSIQDSGVGFEPQSLDRLFQTFYTTKEEGMGIGLSVSRSIIENHQGRLWASPNDGPGVTFSFSIPCAVER